VSSIQGKLNTPRKPSNRIQTCKRGLCIAKNSDSHDVVRISPEKSKLAGIVQGTSPLTWPERLNSHWIFRNNECHEYMIGYLDRYVCLYAYVHMHLCVYMCVYMGIYLCCFRAYVQCYLAFIHSVYHLTPALTELVPFPATKLHNNHINIKNRDHFIRCSH
jgi:hypothetical protein